MDGLAQLRADMAEVGRLWVKNPHRNGEWLDNFIVALTADWKVEKKRVRDGAQRYYEITTAHREPNPAEVESDAAHEARDEWLYRRGDSDAPPPSSVTTRDLLNQQVWWIAGDGRAIRLTEMTPDHRVNLLFHLRRWAPSLQIREWNSGIFLNAPDEVADMAAEQDPIEWLHHHPFVKRLRKLIRKDNRERGTS